MDVDMNDVDGVADAALAEVETRMKEEKGEASGLSALVEDAKANSEMPDLSALAGEAIEHEVSGGSEGAVLRQYVVLRGDVDEQAAYASTPRLVWVEVARLTARSRREALVMAERVCPESVIPERSDEPVELQIVPARSWKQITRTARPPAAPQIVTEGL